MITWRKVTSSNVAAIGWPSTGEPLMLVRYKNGHVYGYTGVSRQRAVAIVYLVKSVGRYMNIVVKPMFPSLRMPELD